MDLKRYFDNKKSKLKKKTHRKQFPMKGVHTIKEKETSKSVLIDKLQNIKAILGTRNKGYIDALDYAIKII
jgi:hypothetical protein